MIGISPGNAVSASSFVACIHSARLRWWVVEQKDAGVSTCSSWFVMVKSKLPVQLDGPCLVYHGDYIRSIYLVVRVHHLTHPKSELHISRTFSSSLSHEKRRVHCGDMSGLAALEVSFRNGVFLQIYRRVCKRNKQRVNASNDCKSSAPYLRRHD